MRATISSFAALLLMVHWAFAGLIAPRSLIDLEQNAELIVVGTASGTFSSSQAINFTVTVNRAVKGDSNLAGQTISVYWPSATITVPVGTLQSATGTGLWFLRQENSRWVLIPVMEGSPDLSEAYLPTADAPILPAYAYAPAAALTDKLGSEVAS